MQKKTPATTRTSLDRSSRIPLYLQIKEHVRRALAEDSLHDGRLFTEQELCRRFGVSRMTVRQAITQLVDEGLLYRQRGVGTIRTAARVTESLERVRDHFEDWESEGRSVSLRILDFKQVEAGSDVARRLRIPERTEVLHLTRLWIVDGVPTGLVYFYLHPSASRNLSPRDVERAHVHVALSKRLGIRFLREQVEIEAGVATRVMAARLKIQTGDPVLIRRLTQLYGTNQPLVAANCYYRADLYRYAVYVPSQSGSRGVAMHTLRGGRVTMRAIAAERGNMATR